jgi:hypothetical protein
MTLELDRYSERENIAAEIKKILLPSFASVNRDSDAVRSQTTPTVCAITEHRTLNQFS